MRVGETEVVTFDGERTTYFREIERPVDYKTTHVIKGSDRLDNLAYKYYNDPSKFWLIVDANEGIINNVMEPLPVGEKIVIPKE